MHRSSATPRPRPPAAAPWLPRAPWRALRQALRQALRCSALAAALAAPLAGCSGEPAAESAAAPAAQPPAAQPPAAQPPGDNPWPAARFRLLRALALPPTDESQPAPGSLASLGRALFFDTGLNPETGLGCVSCHAPALAFSDGRAHPPGNPQRRNAPGLLGATEQRWQFWDGRADSAWSQALGPLLARHEIGLDADALLRRVSSQPRYRTQLLAAFGDWPTQMPDANSESGRQLQARLGLAIEAYLRHLRHRPAPFDRYVAALAAGRRDEAERWLDPEQRAGLAVMLRSNCLSCHRGPNFSDGEFHNIGTADGEAGRDPGRAEGLRHWRADPFNCAGETARAIERSCAQRPATTAEITGLQDGAFKTPSLRALTHTAPYLHDGRHATLEAVIEHYRHPPAGRHALADIALSDREARQLSAFLRALSAPIDVNAWHNRAPHDGDKVD